MTLSDAITKAVRDNDARAAGVVADVCRFRLGMNYDQILERVRQQYPDLDIPSWDELLYEADMQESA